jgi:hypothetical protein
VLLTERASRRRGDELDAEDVCRRELGMKRWSIAMLAAGVLAYGGMEAQTPAKRLDRKAAARLALPDAAWESPAQQAM